MPEVDRHDTSAIYRKLTLGELQKEVPQLDWREYLKVTLGDVNLTDDEALVSYAMPYLVQMGKIVAETDRRILHNYIIWRLVSGDRNICQFHYFSFLKIETILNR